MTLRGLPILVCLMLALAICKPTHAWSGGGPVCGGVSEEANGGGSSGSGGAASRAGGASVDGAASTGGGLADIGAARPYSLRAIYFRRDQFRSTADCVAAAYGQRLPLEVCQ